MASLEGAKFRVHATEEKGEGNAWHQIEPVYTLQPCEHSHPHLCGLGHLSGVGLGQ